MVVAFDAGQHPVGDGLALAMVPQLVMQPSAALIAFTQLLVLPAADLEELIDRELAENPALDRLEERHCPGCGRPVGDTRCPACTPGAGRTPPSPGQVSSGEPLHAVAHSATVAEQLFPDVAALLAPEDHPVAAYVLADLDDRGLLGREPGDVATALGTEEDRVVRVVEAIRAVGPPGICARDVVECLLLQLEPWEARGEAPPHARAMITEHLEDLGKGRSRRIARSLGITDAEVAATRDFLRRCLRPYVTFEGVGADRPARMVADVVVRARADDPEELEVDVPQWRALRVDPCFARFGQRTAEQHGWVSKAERERVAEQVARGRSFLSRLHQRSATLRLVAEQVLVHQKGFLRLGPAAHVPLTRAEIARELGMHESTVSRAVNGKHVQLPDGRIIPFGSFFGSTQSPRECLRAVLAEARQPLSDRQLAAELQARGHRVARRTVAKYRAQLGVAPQLAR